MTHFAAGISIYTDVLLMAEVRLNDAGFPTRSACQHEDSRHTRDSDVAGRR